MTSFPVAGPNGELVGRIELTDAAIEAVAGLPDAWAITPVTRTAGGIAPHKLIGFNLTALPATATADDAALVERIRYLEEQLQEALHPSEQRVWVDGVEVDFLVIYREWQRYQQASMDRWDRDVEGDQPSDPAGATDR